MTASTDASRARSAQRRSRWPWWVTGALLLASAGVGVGWAATTILTPAEDVLDATPFTFVSVEPGEAGSSIALNTVAAWTPVPVGANQAVGVVTEVLVAPGDEVSQGSILYSVGLRPVVVAAGDVPAFRAIGRGTKGRDVAQAQQMLAAAGFYTGLADGNAEAGTVAAIRAWQRAMGVAQTGSIEVGDVIFVPQLPTRVALNTETVARGATLSGGEEVVRALPAAPAFVVPVTEAQAGLMPLGTRVEITNPEGGTWEGFVAEQIPDEEPGTVNVSLTGADNAVLCDDQCEQVPVIGEVRLAARIITVESVAGLVVPSAALATGADGTTAVIDADGERLPVTVVTSARGTSVVEGVPEGTRVRVPATEDP